MNVPRLVAAANRMLNERGVRVYPDWTQACVDFLINEVPQEASNEKTLLDHVWKQYIDSDLAEIATPALPDLGYDLGQAHKVSIGAGAGCGIILQIMDIMEMQFSKLSMLGDVEKELEGRKFGGYQRIYLNADEQNDENGGDANAMGIPPTQLAPGASQGPAVNVEETHKAKTVNFHRGMLKFILTDGHQKIEGMELKIVPGLSMYTPPGTKVRITNGIIRRGVLEMSPKTVVEILAGREWQMDPLLDIRRRLRLCLGKPVDPDEDFAAADIQPPPEPDAGPQGGRNPQSPNRAQQRPHEPSRAYDAASPQRINGPSGRAYNGPDDLGLNVLDDFGMDEEFESHQAQNHQPVRRPGTTEPPRSRRLGPATGSQKTPERDFSKRWNATGVIEVSPPVRNLSHVIFPSQLAKKTPIQQRVAHGEWDDVDDDDLWNDLDPDQLAATGSAQDRVVATPARPSSRQLPRDGVARISLELAGGGKKRPASPGSNLDDMDDDLLLDLDDPLPVKKAAPAPSMPIVVYLVDDDEIEFVPESSRRDQVQAGPSRLRDIAKDRPAVSSFSKNTSAETDMLSIDQVEDVIRNRTSASAWLDVRVVWYSGLRLVDEDNTELELNLIVRDGSGDLAIKFSDKVLAQLLGFNAHDITSIPKGSVGASRKQQMWKRVRELENQLLSMRMRVKVDLQPTWHAVNLISNRDDVEECYPYLPVALEYQTLH